MSWPGRRAGRTSERSRAAYISEKNERDDKDEQSNGAANACESKRASMGAEAFAKKYGTNHDSKNAFGKCVSGKAKAKDKDDKDDD